MWHDLSNLLTRKSEFRLEASKTHFSGRLLVRLISRKWLPKHILNAKHNFAVYKAIFLLCCLFSKLFPSYFSFASLFFISWLLNNLEAFFRENLNKGTWALNWFRCSASARQQYEAFWKMLCCSRYMSRKSEKWSWFSLSFVSSEKFPFFTHKNIREKLFP